MKRATLLASIALLGLAASALADASIGDVSRIDLRTRSWPYYSKTGYGEGGEFRVTVASGLFKQGGIWYDVDGITYGDVSLPVGAQFSTFCIEEDETVSGSDSSYWAVVNTSAVKGNGGNSVGGNPLYNPALDPDMDGVDSLGQNTLGDPLDPRTAYLFTQFSNGTLSNYRYTGTQAQRKADAGALQAAIWAIEQEITLSADPNKDVLAKAWIKEAEDEIAAGNWSGLGDVRVLNLYGSYTGATGAVGSVKQDILVIPAPAAIVLGLMGLGLAGWLKKRIG